MYIIPEKELAWRGVEGHAIKYRSTDAEPV